MTRSPAALAALGAARPRLSERWIGEVPSGGRTLELSRGADLLGLEWDAADGPHVQLRLRSRDGASSPWVSAAGCFGGELSLARAQGRLIGAPVWTAGASAVQLRAARALSDVRLHVVHTGGGPAGRRAALARSRLGLSGSLAPAPAATQEQPPIIARAAWAQGMAHPRVTPGYGAVRMGFVHHTENPNGYLASEVPAMLFAIFLYHRDVRGWDDIGYNFVIDAFGRIFEARAGGIDEPVVGAQAGGFNLVSTGVAVLGSFSAQAPPPAALRALKALLAWKLSLHGVPAQGRVRVRVNPAGAVYSRFPAGARVWLPHIAGHRDGDSTDCPGDAFYARLPALRSGVDALARDPARATLALSLSSPLAQPQGQPPAAPSAFALDGRLTLLDGVPIAGAPVELQARSASARGEVVRERTLAEVSTDAAGAWSLSGAPVPAPMPARGKRVWLRALYRGRSGNPAGAAAVSDPVAVPAAVVSALAGAPTQAAPPPPSA